MKYEDITLKEWFARLASADPVPGGGAAAAVTGAIGTALTSMASAVTMKRPSSEKYDKEKLIETSRALDDLRKKMIEFADEDSEAFLEYMRALKLPRETPEQADARKQALAEAKKSCLSVSEVILETAGQALQLTLGVTDMVNPGIVSDIGCAAAQLRAAAQSAWLNVCVNTRGNCDSSVWDRAKACEEAIQEKVERRLCPAQGIERIFGRAKTIEGEHGIWYKNLVTGEEKSLEPDHAFVAASVIKLFVMAEAFACFADGRMSAEEEFIVRPEYKLPSCGALTYLRDYHPVTAMELVTLMIILSDNTATNMLIDRIGMDAINSGIERMGIPGCRLNRKLFDSEASARGIQNRITPRGVGLFLEKLYRGEVVSTEASRKMLDILSDQRLNGKIPFYLGDYRVAHKTGEDDGITHDAAVVYTPEPFVLVMLSEHADTQATVRLIQDAGKACL